MSRKDLWEVFKTERRYYEQIRAHHAAGAGCQIEPHVRELVDAMIRGKVLDAGCGEGSITRFFAARHPEAEFVGVDISPIGIEMASEEKPPNATFQIGELETLPFDDNAFDLVYSQSAIEHVADLQKVLEEFYRVLKPGGRLIIRVGNAGVRNVRLRKALFNYVFRRNTLQQLEPTCELREGHETEDRRENFDSYDIPSDVLLRMLKKIGFEEIYFTTHVPGRRLEFSLKEIAARAVFAIPSFPFRHLGPTIVVMVEK